MHFLVICMCILAAQAEYTLIDDYEAHRFADMFNFVTFDDPTNGNVNYVDRGTAFANGLYKIENNKVYIGVDPDNQASGRGRNSVRIHSKATYTHGLFILDLQHMPGSVCGTWPAFWLVGKGEGWPNKGEIDIIEGVNTQKGNSMALHTTDGCRISKRDDFYGHVESENCYVRAPNQFPNQGCSINTDRQETYGNGFNAAGGGVYATDWNSDSIRVWHFKRDSIPEDIKNGHPNPSSWPKPLARFAGQCNLDEKFKDHEIVFDITFCGDWAGGNWPYSCAHKGPSCKDFVFNNPHEFRDSFWLINSLKVYRNNGGPQQAPTQGSRRISIQCNNGRFVSSEDGADGGITCNRPNPDDWERFELIPMDNKFALKANNGRFCSAEENGRPMRCDRGTADVWEKFEKIDNGDGTISLKAWNGKFVTSENGERAMSSSRDRIDLWEKFRIVN